SVAVLGASGVYLLAIRLLEWRRGLTYTNQFTLWMFLAHVLLGVVFILPYLVFGITHYVGARNRKNRLAVKLGVALFLAGVVVGVTGLALIQLEGLPQLPTGSAGRTVTYVLHVVVPVLAVVLYVLHRRAGPEIKWAWGYAWGGAVAAFVAVMCVMHAQDPRQWYARAPAQGERYFQPAKTRT